MSTREGAVGAPGRATRLALTLTCAVALASSHAAGPADAVTDSGPRLTVSTAKLEAATACDAGARSGRPTVLLVHGFDTTARESWAPGYERALPRAGFGWCTVQLPARAMGSAGASVQYVVHAAREAYAVSGQRIALLGHSEGGLLVAWAATYWPDVAEHATDVIGLAPPLRGTALADDLCPGGPCLPAVWQLRTSSAFTAALARAPLPTSTSFSAIASATDEVVYPEPEVSTLPGVSTLLVQQPCPGRSVQHAGMLVDAVAYDLVLDALTHDGPADFGRLRTDACARSTIPGSTPVPSTTAKHPPPATDREPPVPSYAR